MHRLQFHYTLGRDSSPALVRNPLIDLLQAVALHGSISAAARALGLSQPTLSRQVAALAPPTDTVLVNRAMLGAMPTPLGAAIFIDQLRAGIPIEALIGIVRIGAAYEARVEP